ncbi:hypothetical protein BGZ46_003442 [Entomortierella lignicola]|nr:hypothetical protein BGZ46_003442 [Entomortierella lignicola]
MFRSQSFQTLRTLATKTVVVKANTATTKAASTYVPKAASRTTYAKSATTTKGEFSVDSASFSAGADSNPPESLSYSDYADEYSSSNTTTPSAMALNNSDAGRSMTEAFSNVGSALKDSVIGERGPDEVEDWTRSFSGMAIAPFEKEVADLLMKPLDVDDIEIKPDGLLYLPEIKYRRILNKAFGPGGWGLAPRSEHSVSAKTISREYALICRGRFVSTARGEQDYFDANNLATASEGCKSNALMRCCKDLGIASELWDPSFIRKFKKQYCEELFVEHAITKKKKKLWKRKDQADFDYPYSKGK